MTLDDIVERLPKALELPWPLDPAGQESPFYQVFMPHEPVLSPPLVCPAPLFVRLRHAKRRRCKCCRFASNVAARMR